MFASPIDTTQLVGFDPNLGAATPAPFDPYVDGASQLPTVGPCELWCTVEDLVACDADLASSPYLDWALSLATAIMWVNSGRQYGLCRRVKKPYVPNGCSCGRACGWNRTARGDWSYSLNSCAPDKLRLPGKVAAIEAVVIDGEVLDPSNFGILANRRDVIRLDGERWPAINDIKRSPEAQWPPLIDCAPWTGPTEIVTHTSEVGTTHAMTGDCPTWVAEYLNFVGWEPVTETSGVAEIEAIVKSGAASDWVVKAFSNSDLAEQINRKKRPDWLVDFLVDAGIDVIVAQSNDCVTCCDPATGKRRDPVTGAQYVCTHAIAPISANSSVKVIPGGCGTCGPQTIDHDNCFAGCQPVAVPAGCDLTQPVIELRCDVEHMKANTWGIDALQAAGLNGCGPLYSVLATSAEPACVVSEFVDGCITTSKPQPFPEHRQYNGNDGSAMAERERELRAAPASCGPAWEVRYWSGLPIPIEARGLAAILATQLISARCSGSGGDCGLSAGLTTLARSGTVLNFSSAKELEALKGAYTNIAPVDLWLRSQNPLGRRRRTRVIRPDNPRRGSTWSWV